jgi:hypothetical protein
MPPFASPSPRPRLAAIDLDGTLLAPDHTISPANAAAVARLPAAGVRPGAGRVDHPTRQHVGATQVT